MRARTVLGLALSATLVATLLGPTASASVTMERVIVRLSDSTSSPAQVADRMVAAVGGSVGHVYRYALKGFSAEIPSAALNAFRNDPRVVDVTLDQPVEAFAENIPTGINRMELDKKLSITSSTVGVSYANQVDVAVIDTGIDAAHPDLNVVGGVDCARQSGCVNGLPGDGNGHGTHVSGTIAAKDNGSGVVGVVPGANLWAVRVLDNRGSGYISWIVAGIDWVTARASTIEVANMSLGCECSDPNLDTAIYNATAAGLVIAVAAGNNGANASTFSPANNSNVIAVAAVSDSDGKAGGAGGAPSCRNDGDDVLASFSNYGNVVDIAAPGVCILSTWPGGKYNTISGTSMASPHVAGAAALYIVQNSTAKSSSRWSTVMNGLQGNGWSVSPNNTCGYGGRASGNLLMLAACDVASGGGGGAVAAPGSFTKTAPANGATRLGKNVNFSWASSSGATGYTLSIYSSTGGFIKSFSTTATSITIRFGTLTTYQWQVVASNTGGTTAATGGNWTFTN